MQRNIACGRFPGVEIADDSLSQLKAENILDISHSLQATKNMCYTGLKIMAGQRTMSVLIADLTGQTLILPVILGYEHFIIHIVVA